jgi:hypothetical protein
MSLQTLLLWLKCPNPKTSIRVSPLGFAAAFLLPLLWIPIYGFTCQKLNFFVGEWKCNVLLLKCPNPKTSSSPLGFAAASFFLFWIFHSGYMC